MLKWFMFSMMCSWTTVSFGQSTTSAHPTVVEYPIECDCGNTTRRLLLPSGYVLSKPVWYGEGSLRTFRYADQSCITLLCGTNAQLSLPKKQAKDKFYRKEQLPNCCCQLMYSDVPSTQVALFNRLLNEMSKL